MIYLEPINDEGLQFDHIVGTGGIGSGIFFSITGNDTLGRNESRMGALLPYKDFCKQHIILHYISILLGAKPNGHFQCFPIGKVGNDDIGKALVRQMGAVGMDTGNIGIADGQSTLFSVCYQYPDYSGGNITTANSASSSVCPEDISSFFRQFSLSGKREIILAAPEVPVAARISLLKYGRERGSLNIASISSSEVDQFRELGGFKMVDVLSVNMEEARSIAKIGEVPAGTKSVVDVCINTLKEISATITVLITDGANGSYCYNNNQLEYTPALKVPVVSTAGAGDAFLAGTIVGLCCGLPLGKGRDDGYFSESPIQSAVELGTLMASLSITSRDTIHLSADATLLYTFAKDNHVSFSPGFSKLFNDKCI